MLAHRQGSFGMVNISGAQTMVMQILTNTTKIYPRFYVEMLKRGGGPNPRSKMNLRGAYCATSEDHASVAIYSVLFSVSNIDSTSAALLFIKQQLIH